MTAERRKLETALVQIVGRLGLTVERAPTDDEVDLQDQLRAHPGLLWKAVNVRSTAMGDPVVELTLRLSAGHLLVVRSHSILSQMSDSSSARPRLRARLHE